MRALLPGLVLLAGVLLGTPALAGPGGVRTTLAFEPDAFGRPARRELPLHASDDALPTPSARIARLVLGADYTVRIAVDTSGEPWKLWVDGNQSGTFTDDEQVPVTSRSGTGKAEADLLVPAGAEGDLPVRFVVKVRRDRPLEVVMYAHRRGEVVIAGRRRLVALVDGNANLRFDEPDADWVLLDVDGDGTLDKRDASPDRLRPGATVRLGRRGYRVQVLDPFGAGFQIEPTSAAARLRPWPPGRPPPSARTPPPPSEDFAELSAQFDREKPRRATRRVKTVSLIGRLGTHQACALLRSIAHQDRHEDVRTAAVKSMGNRAYYPCGAAELLDIALHGKPDIRRAAIPALHDMGHPDRASAYETMLDSKDARFAGEAARYLAFTDSPTARRVIDDAINRAKDTRLRRSLYVFGARSHPEGPFPKTISRLALDPDPQLAHTALGDLYTIGHEDAYDRAIEAAASPDRSRGATLLVIRILASAASARGVRTLLDLLEGGDLDPGVQAHLLQSLRDVRDDKALREIDARLESPHRAVRLAVAQLLAAMPGAATTQALVRQAAKEQDEEVLAAILELLSDRADPEAVGVLIGIARKRGHALRSIALGALARIGLANRKARAFFLRLLEQGAWGDQVFAIQAVAVTNDPSLCGAVLERLDHARWQVRVAVVEAVDRIRCRQAVPVLIERLDTEGSLRVRTMIGDVLFRLTGVNLYDDVALWRRWWAESGATFRVPDEVPQLPSADAGATTAGFYGIPLRSNRIVFVLDQSGSMNAPTWIGKPGLESRGTRWSVATGQLLDAIAPLGADARVNVVLFSSHVRPWRSSLISMSRANKAGLKAHIERSRPLGGTNIYDGLERALEDPEADTIFLLSDGIPSEGRFLGEDDIVKAVRHLNQTRRIAIHTVSIGADSPLLERLARENGGKYVRH